MPPPSLTPATLRTRHPKDYPHILPYRTRFLDCDAFAHMNNAVYQHLFDSIINEYLITSCGQSLHHTLPGATNGNTEVREGGSGGEECIGLIVQASITYLAPVVFPEVVRVGVRVLPGAHGLKRAGGSSVTYECAVFGEGRGEDDDTPRAIGRMTHVFVEREKRRPMKGGMPKRVRDGLRRLQVGVDGEEGQGQEQEQESGGGGSVRAKM